MQKIQKIVSLVLVVVLIFAYPITEASAGEMIDSTSEDKHSIKTAYDFAGGTGTETDPYRIANAEQFELYRNYYGSFGSNMNYFVLTDDIYLNEDYNNYEQWGEKEPANVVTKACGNLIASCFDGQGHTVYGAYINENALFTSGTERMIIKNVDFSHFYCKNSPLITWNFFGELIKDINISNGIIVYDKSNERNVYGGAIGEAGTTLDGKQTVENVHINATFRADMVTGETGEFGEFGMLGGAINSNKIIDCSSSGKLVVSFSDKVEYTSIGGLTGASGSLYNCVNNAEITVNLPKNKVYSDIAGVCGDLTSCALPPDYTEYRATEVVNCINTGSITINTKYNMKYAAANSLCRQNECVAGIISNTGENAKIENCVNKGDIDVTFGYYVAGIVNECHGDVKNCLNEGKINGDSNHSIAGIANNAYGNISYCENRGDITAVEQLVDKSTFFESADIAGIVTTLCFEEKTKGGKISYCKNTGNLTGKDASQWMYVSGIVKSISQNSFEKNSVSNSVTYCYNSGNITGPTPVGIVGNSGGKEEKRNSVKYCVNEGTIHMPYNDDRYAGIGFACSYTDVTYCYNLGKLTSDYNKYHDRTAQIIGMNNEGGVINKCYILNKGACSYGASMNQLGGKSTNVVRKKKSTMLNYKTVQKIINKAGCK